jgi:hypothetical protein
MKKIIEETPIFTKPKKKEFSQKSSRNPLHTKSIKPYSKS